MAKEVGLPLFILRKSHEGVHGQCAFCPYESPGYGYSDAEQAAVGMVRQHLQNFHLIDIGIDDTTGRITLCETRPHLRRDPKMNPIPIRLMKKPASLMVKPPH